MLGGARCLRGTLNTLCSWSPAITGLWWDWGGSHLLCWPLGLLGTVGLISPSPSCTRWRNTQQTLIANAALSSSGKALCLCGRGSPRSAPRRAHTTTSSWVWLPTPHIAAKASCVTCMRAQDPGWLDREMVEGPVPVSFFRGGGIKGLLKP